MGGEWVCMLGRCPAALYLVALVLAATVPYLNALDGGLVYDDKVRVILHTAKSVGNG